MKALLDTDLLLDVALRRTGVIGSGTHSWRNQNKNATDFTDLSVNRPIQESQSGISFRGPTVAALNAIADHEDKDGQGINSTVGHDVSE